MDKETLTGDEIKEIISGNKKAKSNKMVKTVKKSAKKSDAKK